SPRDIDALIKYPFNGANFSTRIWKQKDFLEQKLMEDLTTIMVRGVNPRVLSKEFAKHFDRRKYEAYRLLHTESAFISEQATLQGYTEEGVEKYQILATLDHKTSDICQKQDNKVYDVGKAVVGVNYPPFHQFCRTTTVPKFDDEEITTRVARDPITNKSYEVPADMDFNEWYRKYVVDEYGQDQVQVMKNKMVNRTSDKVQHSKYKLIFGDKIPSTLEDFQELKYNNVKEWENIRAEKQDTLNSLDYRDSFFGKFGDREVREWYIAHDKNIPNLI
ncbi:minor capsid protein, partial [Stenotrophomonas maltophilia group sp. RNC7]|uniref:minor capsid protein n=1 Tax=Stenotrophomonas maltophilia group sp. RNC7 TaxID=3071467 RepID=UPI0027E14DD2